ncbi:MAG: hypothetical protein EXR71_18250 [Myxococcales bacterium]|nr:hypothetical protein [Myxococcales bacterium]
MIPVLLSLFACVESEPAATETTTALGDGSDSPAFRAELIDYDAETDGILVAELVEEVLGTPPRYPRVESIAPVNLDGYVTIALPTPGEDGPDSVRYRVIFREARTDGSIGPIRESWQPALVWSQSATVAGAPAGWSVEAGRRGQREWSAIGSAEVELRLRTESELVIGGPFTVSGVVADAGTSIRIALLDEDTPIEGVVGMVAEGMWGLRVDDDLGLTLGQFLRPVAFLDADDDLAYDPASEAQVGIACARADESFIRWLAEPTEVRAADVLTRSRATPGWNAWVATGETGHPLFDASRVRIAATCE